LVVAPVAVALLGASTASAAIWIAVAFDGISGLNGLRKYYEISRKDGKLVLKRR